MNRGASQSDRQTLHMSELLRTAVTLLEIGEGASAFEAAGAVTELALGMNADAISRLSPAGVVSLVEMGSLDAAARGLVAEALCVQGSVLAASGELLGARLRDAQADAVRTMHDAGHTN